MRRAIREAESPEGGAGAGRAERAADLERNVVGSMFGEGKGGIGILLHFACPIACPHGCPGGEALRARHCRRLWTRVSQLWTTSPRLASTP